MGIMQVALALVAVQTAKGLHHDADLEAAFHVAVTKPTTGTQGGPGICPASLRAPCTLWS